MKHSAYGHHLFYSEFSKDMEFTIYDRNKLFASWEWPIMLQVLTRGGELVDKFRMSESSMEYRSGLIAEQERLILVLLKEAIETLKPSKFIAEIKLIGSNKLNKALESFLAEEPTNFRLVEQQTCSNNNTSNTVKYELVNKKTAKKFIVYNYGPWIDVYRVDLWQYPKYASSMLSHIFAAVIPILCGVLLATIFLKP